MKAVLKSSSGSTRARGAGGARGWFRRRRVSRLWLSTAVAVSLLFGGCFREEKGERFYGKVVVPSTQEFRWSDGGLPKVFDPARAAAPPDTDAVRALYEGLTDYEPGTLRPVPAVASRWESADGGRRWTFHVRESARWTNGDPVTAQDFVRSWQRTLRLGERAPHANLLSNIEGAQAFSANYATNAQGGAAQDVRPGASEPARALQGQMKNSRTPQPSLASHSFGVVALDARTLRVTLQRPDNNFPALVAHPVFRPVHELTPGGELSELWEEQRQQRQGSAPADFGMVTNGAFSLSRLAGDSVELERADSYWDAASVKLERVRFVEGGGTEAALAAYRAGEVDVVTNAAVEPLAVKLLTPYEDFRRETFAALNYYRFNTARPPFDDLRVRQALAFALDTERLSADTLGGATEATHSFMPVHVDAEANGDDTRDEDEKAETEKAEPADKAARAVESREPESDESESGAVASGTVEHGVVERGAVASGAGGGGETGPLVHNVERARRLLEEAGYPGGVNFPRIRLLVNRNEQQRLVAQAVARMWRDSLGVQTEVDVRPWEEYETMLRTGDYDVARRSLVMQTTDEETNMLELFDGETTEETDASASDAARQVSPAATPATDGAAAAQARALQEAPILSETQALRELPAIPLHFASSYALVKPYVDGFESNLLDAPSLKHVGINNEWRPPAPEQDARLARRPVR